MTNAPLAQRVSVINARKYQEFLKYVYSKQPKRLNSCISLPQSPACFCLCLLRLYPVMLLNVVHLHPVFTQPSSEAISCRLLSATTPPVSPSAPPPLGLESSQAEELTGIGSCRYSRTRGAVPRFKAATRKCKCETEAACFSLLLEFWKH